MYRKYPRTSHLIWSPGATSDDKRLKSHDAFVGRRIIVTEKLDGENTTFYTDHIHARSLDSKMHPSRDWVRAFWGTIRHDIPAGWRVCGENLFARHSIAYEALPTYFMGFSIWNDTNTALPWDETVEWFRLLGITPVPVLYDGLWDEAAIKALWTPADAGRIEGYVVRVADPIPYDRYGELVGKFVRANHVQTDQHWMHAEIVKNGLQGA